MDFTKTHGTASQIGTLILSPLHKAYRQAILYMEGEACDLSVSSSETHIIAYIKRFGPCPMCELSRVFGHKKSTVTSMLDRLTEKGFISREVNPDDRRSFLLAIRPEGEAVSEAAGALVEGFEREVSQRITAQDMEGFQNVLRAIAKVTQVDVRKGNR